MTSRGPVIAPSPPRNAPRPSFFSKLTIIPSRGGVSVVPYAPERLSISQPTMTATIAEAISTRGSISAASKIESERRTSTQREERPNTLFAALRMRRVLRKAASGVDTTEEKPTVDEAQAILDRHMKVLSRYKIRRVNAVETEAQHLKNLGRFMVNPHSTMYKIWQLMTLVIIIYQSLALPYTLAFGTNDNNNIDIFMNTVFALDIVIQFNTPISTNDTEEGEYITNRKQIARTYAKGWFIFDLLSCIPFDYVLLLINNFDSKGNLNVLGLLKAVRIPRLLRLVRLLRVVKIFKIRPELRRWLQYSRHANLLRLVRLVMLFLVINHYMACIWYGGMASDQTKTQYADSDPTHLYLASFYLCLLVIMGQNITIYDDTEYLFCILSMVFGAVLMAVVFGNVAILIANYYENQSSHQKKMEWLFASMNRMKLPNDLQNRINDYYQAMWERHGTLDGAVTAFIPELSRNLAYEVELFLRMDMINRAPIFQNCSAKVVQELVMELELQVFMPGDYVVVRGEVGNDMYFLQNGICEVTKDIGAFTERSTTSLHPDGQAHDTHEIVLKVLEQGDYFGEIALLMNCKRTANVRAQVFSELCTLTREVFESISLRYLEDRNIIEKFIMDKYDPNMLQAAMKQSQEVTMRTSLAASTLPEPTRRSISVNNGGGGGGIIGATGIGGGASSDWKAMDVLIRIEERLQRLECQIDQESQERRDNELRQSKILEAQCLKQPTVGPSTSDYIAFEPDRMSQRNLLSPVRSRHSASSSDFAEAAQRISASTAEINSILSNPHILHGVATLEHAEVTKVWKQPGTLNKSGSWRNARREGSSEASRLRALIRQGSGAIVARNSSKRQSIAAMALASEVLSIQHSLLENEPPIKGPSLDKNVDDEDDDEFSTDVLDDLATALTQRHQVDA